ncbi:MAG: c-type cytochrome [Bacteroidetes bacterium]|nr:c-type cytochrome [Bacteroidota bacterium]MBU1680920.1 c-type cytochrome [Bacteroidota bacterium]
MRKYIAEISAAVLVISVLILVPILVIANGPWQNQRELRVIHLTGVQEYGIWTGDEVTGLNYWNTNFNKAHIILNENEEVILKLSSADVTHTFYVPELNLGPVIVEAGHTVELSFKPEKTGEYIYYCTTVCGECHFYMQGELIVLAADEEKSESFTSEIQHVENICRLHDTHFTLAAIIDQGKYIYEQKGCITCHGSGGKGGVFNPNYVNKFVPQLNDIAEKLKIYWEEDAEIIIQLMESSVNLRELGDNPPIDNYNRFLAQYESIINKIHDGAPDLQRLNPEGPIPPLYMPSWKMHLSEKEINAVLAYLINEFPWDDY